MNLLGHLTDYDLEPHHRHVRKLTKSSDSQRSSFNEYETCFAKTFEPYTK